MAYTAEEWAWLKSRLTEGCRFLYDGNSGGWATIHLGPSPFVVSNDRIRAQFDNKNWDQNWSEYGMDKWFYNISNCTWPDGSTMLPFVEYDGTPYNPVLSKIKSLDARFVAKALPKTTQKTLPLPA